MAEKAKFVGSIQHTEDTLQSLFKTAYRTYKQWRILTQMTIGFAMIAMAILADMGRILQAILLLIGCLLIVSGDLPASAQDVYRHAREW